MKKEFVLLIILCFIFSITGCTNNEDVFTLSYLSLETDTIDLVVNDSEIIPITYDGNQLYTDLNFDCDKDGYVTIDEGIITGIKPGIVTITISAKNNKKLTASLIVYINDVDYKKGYVRMDLASNGLIIGGEIPMSIANMEMVKGSSFDDFNFTLSDPNVLKIDDEYNIIAINNGVCTILARHKRYPSIYGEFTINVGLQSNDTTRKGEPDNTPLIAYFEDNNYIIDADNDEQITILGAIDYQRYYYIVDDESVLLISDTGKFMGVKEGETKVTISSKDASSNICKTTLSIKVTGERKRDYVTALLEVALAEVGYREWTDNNDTKYGEWNYCNYEAWCAIFVSWCLNNAGVPKSICMRNISVTVYETQYRIKNQFYLKEGYQPAPGDLIIFSSAGASHIGIVVSSDDKYVYTVEGNTSNMVARRQYELDYETITGYIKPNYNE